MPKFKLKSDINYNKCFESMGINSFFDFSQDFSSITAVPAKGADILQKIELTVDEKGTAVLSSSGITVETLCIKKEFIINRPFILAINIDSISLVFGVVRKPQLEC